MAENDQPSTATPAEEVDTRTRAQAKRELHQRKVEERKKLVEERKHNYAKIKDEPAIQDILLKARQFAAYHTKLAKDGVGARQNGVDDSGAPIVEDYYLTSEQRLGELDQAKGIEQIISYIENQLA